MEDDIPFLQPAAMDDNKYAMMNNGINPQVPKLLSLLELNMFGLQRFRDAGYDTLTKRIWVLVRSGSTNHLKVSNQELKGHPFFESCVEDAFDRSYEFYHFIAPDTEGLNHVPKPNLKWLSEEAGKRLECGELNEYEKQFYKENLTGLAGGWLIAGVTDITKDR